jgi:hypothetical protein
MIRRVVISSRVVKASRLNWCPEVIKVIRQRKTNNLTNWWNSSNDADTFYSSILNEKHYICCFYDNKNAEKCMEFLKKYKKINNRYPELHGNKKALHYIEQNEQLYIDIQSVHFMKSKCLLNNIGLIAITDFDYTYIDRTLGQRNVFDVNISTVDLLDCELLGPEQYIDHLNYLLDF